MTFYEAINKVISSSTELRHATKRDVIKGYESLKEIRVVDSAFPKSLGDFIREELNIRDIGLWSYAYGEIATHGVLVPCNERALALFDVLLADAEVPTFDDDRYEVPVSIQTMREFDYCGKPAVIEDEVITDDVKISDEIFNTISDSIANY